MNPDELLRDVLTDEYVEKARIENEPGLLEEVDRSLRGRRRNLILAVWAATAAFLGLAVWAAVVFFQTDVVQTQIFTAVGFVTCIFTQGLLRMWYWMELNKNAVTREVKRVELQVARLADKLNS